MDELLRFTTVKEKITKLSESKIRYEERYKTELEKLEAQIKEITAKGYDPSKLVEIKTTKQAELEKTLIELENSVKEVTEKLNSIESTTING